MNGYRRLFIVRKDLHMSTGKISAQLSHCAELYWICMIKKEIFYGHDRCYADLMLDKEMCDGYLFGKITKTVCSAKNLHQLLRAKEFAKAQGLVEGKDFGFINDNCLTELTPENPDGTTTTAFWTGPIPDDVAHAISKKYQLYTD